MERTDTEIPSAMDGRSRWDALSSFGSGQSALSRPFGFDRYRAEARMSRAGYSDDIDGLQLGRWRAQVASAIRGKRGQAFLRELIEALDALPAKRLTAHDLIDGSEVCAIGSVGLRRGIDMSHLDPDDPDTIAGTFGIAHQLVREIEYMNDEASWDDDPERRWKRMRDWALSNLKEPVTVA